MAIRRLLIGLTGAAALAAAAPAGAAAVTRYVDDNRAQCPQAAFTRIQPAIDASSAADRIVVCDGLYRGALTIGPGKDGLVLTSNRPLRATISTPSAGAATLVHIAGSRYVSLLRFRVTGPNAPLLPCEIRRAIQVEDGSAVIRDNRVAGFIQRCNAQSIETIVVGENARASIIGNVIDDLHTAMRDDFYPLIGNPTWGATGILLAGPGSWAHISGNEIHMPRGGVGVYLGSSNAEIVGTTITGAHDAIHGDGGGGRVSPIGKGTSIRHNALTGNVNGAVIGNYWNVNSYDPYQNFGPPKPAPVPDEISFNRITHNSGAGILIGGFDLITGLKVRRNVVQQNRTGIELVHALRPFIGDITDVGNFIGGNDARFNRVRDCFEGIYDGFYPGGTPTALSRLYNTWYENRGTKAVLPAGICR